MHKYNARSVSLEVREFRDVQYCISYCHHAMTAAVKTVVTIVTADKKTTFMGL